MPCLPVGEGGDRSATGSHHEDSMPPNISQNNTPSKALTLAREHDIMPAVFFFFPGAHSWPHISGRPSCTRSSGPPPFIKLCMLLLCGIALVSGCTTANRPGTSDISSRYMAESDEMMPIPYTPRDDGLPLTEAELHAFKTVSDLDRQLSEEEARIVELHFKYFVHQRRDTLERFLRRSARFLPHVKKVFTDRGIPEDIAYLFMVESGGNPIARSPAGALGLWQFMPLTGRIYGLKQTNWLDERRDPYKATLAAADYLLKLYNDFSNWHLAVAAYNAGEGKIGRAISGTGASDFFDLCRLDGQLEARARLKDETRDYVPKLIAVAKIMRNLKLLGFSEPDPTLAWDLTPMVVPPGTDLAGLARQLELDWSTFSGMNPAFLRAASPPTKEAVAYVPPDKLPDAVRWAATNEARIYAGWKEYSVRKGDTLASIAKRHKVTVAAIRDANCMQNLPKRGSIILIPGKAPEAGTVAARQAVQPATPSPAERSRVAPSASRPASRYYKVQEGDTLYSLALKWGTDVASIRAANRMGASDNTVKIGQRLTVPGNSKAAPAPRAPAKKPAAPAKPAPAGKKAELAPEAPRPAAQNVLPIPPEEPDVSTSPHIEDIPPLILGSYTADEKRQSPHNYRVSASALPGVGSRVSPASSATYTGGISRQDEPGDFVTGAGPVSRSGLAVPAGYAIRQESLMAPDTPATTGTLDAFNDDQDALPQVFLNVFVKPGQTLEDIARANNVPAHVLRAANNLAPHDPVETGQKILVPKS